MEILRIKQEILTLRVSTRYSQSLNPRKITNQLEGQEDSQITRKKMFIFGQNYLEMSKTKN